MNLDKDFWESRYQEGLTGWDIGYISTPLKEYFDQLKDSGERILIPGAGRGYEVEYLWKKGFRNVHVIDLAHSALKAIKERCPDIPDDQLIEGDFFEHSSKYDRIIEQTFFCALHPELRDSYVEKMDDLLLPDGKVAGLLFDFPLTQDGPPFGGSKEEYLGRFQPTFEVKVLERCYNSIFPRAGRELFFILEKKTGNSRSEKN